MKIVCTKCGSDRIATLRPSPKTTVTMDEYALAHGKLTHVKTAVYVTVTLRCMECSHSVSFEEIEQ